MQELGHMLSLMVKVDGLFVWQPEISGKLTLAHSFFGYLSHSVRLLSESCLTRYRPNAQVMFTEVDDGNTNKHRNVGTQYSIRIQISLMGTYYFWSH